MCGKEIKVKQLEALVRLRHAHEDNSLSTLAHETNLLTGVAKEVNHGR